MLKKVLVVFLALFIVVLVTAFIANLTDIGNSIDKYCGANIAPFLRGMPRIFFYSLKLFFFFFVIVVFNRKFKLSSALLFFSFAIPAVLIDATVFIAGRQLVPLRFPFETLFPIIGLLTGVLYLKSRKKIILISPILVAFIFASHKYFIPGIIRFMEARDSKLIKAGSPFGKGNFYTIKNAPIFLEDTVNKKCVLIEFYFVGCQPCEQKIKYLTALKSKINSIDFEIIMVCDGTISNFASFQAHAKKNIGLGFLFFYDKDSLIKKISGDHGYPYELIIGNKNKIVSSQIGFNAETSEMYLSENYRKIQSVLDR